MAQITIGDQNVLFIKVGDISPEAQKAEKAPDCTKGHSDIRVSLGFVVFVV